MINSLQNAMEMLLSIISKKDCKQYFIHVSNISLHFKSYTWKRKFKYRILKNKHTKIQSLHSCCILLSLMHQQVLYKKLV